MIQREPLGDDGNPSDVAHEKSIPISKYIGLYECAVMIMLFLWFVILVIVSIRNDKWQIQVWRFDYRILMSSYISLKDMSSSIVMYLSFEWNQYLYKDKL